jgi:hypothetical protein
MIRSTSRRDWILGAVQVLMDAGYVSSLEILFQETAILAPEELMRRISELKFLLEQFANEPKKFTSLFSSYSDSYTDEEIQQAVKNTEPPLKPIEWYGDYDSLECLLHFLRRHLALFEFSLQRNLFIFYVRCERFLDSREA